MGGVARLKGKRLSFPNRQGVVNTLAVPAQVWEGEEDVKDSLLAEIASGECANDFDLDAIAAVVTVQIAERRPLWDLYRERVAGRQARRAARTAVEFFFEVPPDPTYLVPGLIAKEQVTLVAGREKLSGKSTHVYWLIGAMERQEATLYGAAYRRAAKTLIVTEEPDSAISDKIEKFGLRDAVIILNRDIPLAAFGEGEPPKVQWERKLEFIERDDQVVASTSCSTRWRGSLRPTRRTRRARPARRCGLVDGAALEPGRHDRAPRAKGRHDP